VPPSSGSDSPRKIASREYTVCCRRVGVDGWRKVPGVVGVGLE
jgi:hypothetical protein